MSAVEGTSCLVLINGDVDAAVECGAHGVHLPERFLEDIPQVQRVACELDQEDQSGAVRLGGRNGVTLWSVYHEYRELTSCVYDVMYAGGAGCAAWGEWKGTRCRGHLSAQRGMSYGPAPLARLVSTSVWLSVAFLSSPLPSLKLQSAD